MGVALPPGVADAAAAGRRTRHTAETVNL